MRRGIALNVVWVVGKKKRDAGCSCQSRIDGGESGGYFIDRKRAIPSRQAQDMEAARKLWDVSERQTGLVTQGG